MNSLNNFTFTLPNLSSDYSPVLLLVDSAAIYNAPRPTLNLENWTGIIRSKYWGKNTYTASYQDNNGRWRRCWKSKRCNSEYWMVLMHLNTSGNVLFQYLSPSNKRPHLYQTSSTSPLATYKTVLFYYIFFKIVIENFLFCNKRKFSAGSFVF